MEWIQFHLFERGKATFLAVMVVEPLRRLILALARHMKEDQPWYFQLHTCKLTLVQMGTIHVQESKDTFS